MHADRDRIRQAQMSGSMSFNDPMERLRTGGGGTAGGRRNSYNQAINGQYTPSFNGGSSAVRSKQKWFFLIYCDFSNFFYSLM